MVILSACIITKHGKILLARQFVDISKINLESLLAIFIQILNPAAEHTYVDYHNSVRFLYHRLDENYLLLITPLENNIIDDGETLVIISKSITHFCPLGFDEVLIRKFVFQIIWAVDEIINQGHRETVSINQIITNIDMESEEERIYKEKINSQVQDAKEVSKRRYLELSKLRLKNKPDIPKLLAPVTESDFEILDEITVPAPVVFKPLKSMSLRLKSK